MLNIKSIGAVALSFGLALTAVVSESDAASRWATAKLTFNRSVALPGVTLAPGSYVFEIVESSGSLDIVRVRNSATNDSEYMGFTHRVPRPPRLRLSAVTLGEAPRDTPAPIKVWYPADGSDGRQFIY
jgi:hypothetical protein